ncbi:MAG: HD domain-containing protein [Clostridia bacterium]|nr:HD domain-containing protein [Clostridia bacterium]
MISDRLKKQLEFAVEIDKMKTVLRRSAIISEPRRENDAEHSWHFATMAMLLYEYADTDNVDLARVLRMALIHDLVEIYAGDTFAFDKQANEDKGNREEIAADKIFGMLPEEQGKEYRMLWEEFDEMKTPDSMYAAAIDRLQPFLLNHNTEGHTWKLGKVTAQQVYDRIGIVKTALPALWEFVENVIEEAINKGYIKNN